MTYDNVLTYNTWVRKALVQTSKVEVQVEKKNDTDLTIIVWRKIEDEDHNYRGTWFLFPHSVITRSLPQAHLALVDDNLLSAGRVPSTPGTVYSSSHFCGCTKLSSTLKCPPSHHCWKTVFFPPGGKEVASWGAAAGLVHIKWSSWLCGLEPLPLLTRQK